MKPTDDGLDAMRRIEEDHTTQRESAIVLKRRMPRVISLPPFSGRLASTVLAHAGGIDSFRGLRALPSRIVARPEARASVANPGPSKSFSIRQGGFGRAANRDSVVESPIPVLEEKPGRVNIDRLDDAWFADGAGFRLQRDRTLQALKRVCDILVSGIALLAFSPLLVLLALLVKLESPGPVFYLQTRTGWNMRPFRMIKFRSMRQDAERDGVRWASENDPRITRAGRFLRLTRLDEAPQLINVLIGDMSLIGPRPERPEFDVRLSREIPHYQSRYAVLPGLSGWAQVMFTYGASVDDAREKLSYDLHYLKHYSLGLDLRIALKTVLVVVTGKGR